MYWHTFEFTVRSFFYSLSTLLCRVFRFRLSPFSPAGVASSFLATLNCVFYFDRRSTATLINELFELKKMQKIHERALMRCASRFSNEPFVGGSKFQLPTRAVWPRAFAGYFLGFYSNNIRSQHNVSNR